MSKRYDAVMENIEVTDAMRQRILTNIDKLELDAAPRAKVSHFPAVKRLMPLAACFVLLLAGVFSARYWMPGGTVDPQPSDRVMVGNGIVEVADSDALSQAVGFPVTGPAELPFAVTETTYTSYFGDLAQIDYVGEDHSVTFRQSLGDEDNSGDYNVYAETEVHEMEGLSVTLKGDGQTDCLAVWNDGTYAYSISAEPGLTRSEWEALIVQIG